MKPASIQLILKAEQMSNETMVFNPEASRDKTDMQP